MLHKTALLLGVLCVACPLTAISETSLRDTGPWMSVGLSRTETRDSGPNYRWDDWQIAAGYETPGLFDFGAQFDWLRSRAPLSDDGLRTLELRCRLKPPNDCTHFVAPFIGVGYGWTTPQGIFSFADEVGWSPLTVRGLVWSVGADLQFQPGGWLAVIVCGSYRWAHAAAHGGPTYLEGVADQYLSKGPDALFEGWSFGVKMRVYPSFGSRRAMPARVRR